MTTLSIAVTGANGGIGRAICQALAEDGHRLHLIGRQSEALEALRNSLKNTAQHHCWQADLSDVRSIDALADAMLGTGVVLDVLNLGQHALKVEVRAAYGQAGPELPPERGGFARGMYGVALLH